MINKKQAEKILIEVKKAKKVLLHCHVSPDGDSYGSSLGMMQILLGMGKKVTLIKGDSPKIEVFNLMAGYKKIVEKDLAQVKLTDYDLFIILDTSSVEQITRKIPVVFPKDLVTVNIDHHLSNTNFAKITVADVDYASCAEMVYDLAKFWKVEITTGIATDLYIGIYTDTGGFRYKPSDYRSLEKAADLAKISGEEYQKVIHFMDNNSQPERIRLMGLALNNIESYFQDRVWVAAVSREDMDKKGIPAFVDKPDLGNILKSAQGVMVGISFLEMETGKVNISMRTRDPGKYDVSRLAVAFGGGGHKAAAGATIAGLSFSEAKIKLLQTIGETFPDLGKA